MIKFTAGAIRSLIPPEPAAKTGAEISMKEMSFNKFFTGLPFYFVNLSKSDFDNCSASLSTLAFFEETSFKTSARLAS